MMARAQWVTEMETGQVGGLGPLYPSVPLPLVSASTCKLVHPLQPILSAQHALLA